VGGDGGLLHVVQDGAARPGSVIDPFRAGRCPLEVEEAEALTMEEHLEQTVLSQVIVPKEAEEEKRIGF
jgi:hypothetical protein